MPPRPLLPNQPAGATDLIPYNPYPLSQASSSSTTPQRNFRVGITQQGPIYLPSELTDQEAQQAVEAYDKYIATLTRAWEESSGLQRRQIESQIEDAKKGRENAMAIAQLNAQTSRYGTDVQAQTRMAELRQNQAQFDQTHGLDVAKAYTAYSQTPDMMFARNDFVNALGRTNAGLGVKPMSTGGAQPHAKTWEDFAALQGFNTPAVQAGRSQGGGGGMQSTASGGGGGKDQRTSAVNAIMKAIPPSDGDGNDGQDWEALNAIRSLYAARRPGSVEGLGKERQKIANAGLARLGYDPALINEDYLRTRPGQGGVRLA
jgi:hypothetical protein